MPNPYNSAGGGVVICADDYALSPGVSRAIADLARRGRISAAGCMTASPEWPEAAAALRELCGQIDIGLHFSLTTLPALGPLPGLSRGGGPALLNDVVKRAHLRKISPSEIRNELARQIDAFTAEMRTPPDFIDGHHHIQQLPVIRDVVVETALSVSSPPPYLRTAADSARAIAQRRISAGKAMILSAGGGKFTRRARAAGLAVNEGFSGVYDFSGRIPYAEVFRQSLKAPGRRHLLMCHPGHPDEVLAGRDEVTDARQAEYDFLSGPAFEDALQAAGLRLARFHAPPA